MMKISKTEIVENNNEICEEFNAAELALVLFESCCLLHSYIEKEDKIKLTSKKKSP